MIKRNLVHHKLGWWYGALALLVTPLTAQARQACDHHWLRGAGLPGIDGGVYAMTTFDRDGGGPLPVQLVAGGFFAAAGGSVVQNIARWDGSTWQPLGSGVGPGAVFALTSFDPDGHGPQQAQLIAGGNFADAGGIGADSIGRWDGSSWSAVGTGMNSDVRCLATFDPDGTGPQPPQLIAGGLFTTAGGISANRIARWNGASWQPLGTGMNAEVSALTTFDPDGDGPLPSMLIAGGRFTTAGGISASRIARWNGTTWQPLGTGIGGTVASLTTVDFDGPGPQTPRLIAGGQFSSAGGFSASMIAQWDGVGWQGIGGGMDSPVEALSTFDLDGSGPSSAQLIAAGSFVSAGGMTVDGIARWSGSAWQPLGAGFFGGVYALATFDPDDAGPLPTRLVAGGDIESSGEVPLNRIAILAEFGWQALGQGMNSGLACFAVHDPDGGGAQAPQLVAGGDFTSAGEFYTNRVARWDGNSWLPLGDGTNSSVAALTSFDADSAGPSPPQLIAGGWFTAAGSVTANRVARWDGTAWHPLGTGMNSGSVNALATLDLDGPGPQPPQLVAGGFLFSMAGGVSASRIAGWNGSSWQAFGAGVNNTVRTLLPFDTDGPGPQPTHLIVGGEFTLAGGISAIRIARWDGAAWSPLGSGMNDRVLALAEFDPDGAGPQPVQLIAGGEFTTAGGVAVNRVARWDGAAWQALAEGVSEGGGVHSLAIFDTDGTGPQASRLMAGGNFLYAGKVGSEVNNISMWDGTEWFALGTGTTLANDPQFSFVHALSPFDPDGESGPALPRLCVGGTFTQAGGNVSAYFAQWGQDTALWGAASSGLFGGSGNWSCGLPPTVFDRLIIDNTQAGYAPASFQITLPVGGGVTTARTLNVRTDTVTFELNGNPFSLTGGSSSVDDPGLIVGDMASQPGALFLKSSTGGGTTFTASAVSIADQPTTAQRLNHLKVQDASTRLVVNGPAFIGRRGNQGRLTLESGGDADLLGTLSVADQFGSVGVLEVTGAGSTLLYGAPGTSAGIGVNGTATFTITSSGAASSAAPLDAVTVGTLTGAQVNATISGAGSTWSTQQNTFAVGYAGDVVMGITAGGQLLTATSSEVWVSRFRESASTLTIRDAGSRWRETAAPVRIGPSGTIDAGPGTTVECPAMIVTEGGFLTGTGLIRGLNPNDIISVQNGGTISPRPPVGSVGVLAINGNLTMSASRDGVTTAGTIAADLAGTSPSQYDRIDLAGTAALSGALRVRLNSGFDPPEGSRFTVLTAAGGITGRFDVGYFPGLAGRLFRIDYVESAQRTVTSVDVVVEAQSARGTFDPSGYSAPGAPSAADLGDLDSDGFLDLVLTIPDASSPETNPGQVAVLINAGNTGSAWNGFVPSSQVTFNTGRLPSSVVIARLRGNAMPNDLAVACAGDNTVQTFGNSGAAVFSAAGIFASGGLRPLDVDAADFTGDGVVDLAVANYGDINPPPSQQLPDRGNARVLNNNGAGAFSQADTLTTGWYPRSLALADFTGDGRTDVATADSGTSEVSVFNRPAGGGPGFLPPVRYTTSGPPVRVEPGGLDNPKDLNDLAIVMGPSIAAPQHIAVMINTESGSGAFNPPVALDVGGPPRDLTTADLDDDADEDIAVIVPGASPNTSLVALLRNNTPPGGVGGVILALEPGGLDNPKDLTDLALVLSGDVDNDGRQDLVTIGTDPGASLLLGRPPPQFVGVSRAVPPSTACVGDLNGDHAVNTADLVAFLGAFGTTVSPNTGADFNGDGAVNTADLVLFLGRFGAGCA